MPNHPAIKLDFPAFRVSVNVALSTGQWTFLTDKRTLCIDEIAGAHEFVKVSKNLVEIRF